MDSEKIIHLQMERPEAIIVKKEMLMIQASLLKIIGQIKLFNALRGHELRNKKKMNAKIRKIHSNLGKLNVLMPEIKKPKILKEKKEKVYAEPKRMTRITDKTDIEKDLEDIQNRLKMLDAKF